MTDTLPAHAVFSPSSAKRWMTCPGSHLLSLRSPPQPSSSYADAGTDAHTYAYNLISEGTATPPESLTEAAAISVREYVKHVKHLTKQLARTGGYTALLEQRLRYNDELFGTADYLGFNAEVMHVVDLKTGTGIVVDPVENAQMLTYGWIAKHVHKVAPKAVLLTIVQAVPDDPGFPAVRTWATTAERLDAHGAQVLAAIEQAKQPGAPLVDGEHCRFCRARPQCPKLMGALEATAKLDVAGLAPAQIAVALDRASRAEIIIKALREHAHAEATRGVPIPGWKLEPKRAMRKWRDEDEAWEVAKAHDIVISKRAVISPAQTEKKFREIPAALKPLVVQESSGTNLVRDTSVPLPDDPPTLAQIAAKPSPQPLQSVLKNLARRV